TYLPAAWRYVRLQQDCKSTTQAHEGNRYQPGVRGRDARSYSRAARRAGARERALPCLSLEHGGYPAAGAMRRLLISSFAPGIKGGATLNERNPIASNCGSISSRPASSPHSVSGISPASATIIQRSSSSEE